MPDNYPGDWDRDESQLWEQIASRNRSDYGEWMADDRQAIALFDAGWIDMSAGDTQAIRDAFFDYCIEEGYFYDGSEFDWDAWREFMGYD